MRQINIFFCFLCSFLFYTEFSVAQQRDFSSYVNPLMGSLSKHSLSNGNTYPAIARPWGMNFWMPQTGKMGNGWSYEYSADKIRGFKQTHQPSPWINDYAQFVIMPITGKVVFDEEKRASWFSHKTEIAKPYYYSVYLADHNVTAEFTPTCRAAMFRFTFPKDDSYIIVDPLDEGSYVKIIPESNKIVGYTTKSNNKDRVVPENFKNYFVIEFDKPFTYMATVDGDIITQNVLESQTNHAGAIIGFPTSKGEIVQARVASSFISIEQAEQNLKELRTLSFEELKKEGQNEWNLVLGRIDVRDENIDNLKTFYSCLYRSVLFPRVFYEIDKDDKVVHYSPYNGEILPGYMYTDTGFWDTFRALFPLLNLIYPDANEKIQAGLVNAYKESGFLPEWASPGHFNSMIGNNSASVVADAYIKGGLNYDIDTLWEAVTHGANAVHPQFKSVGRIGYEYYNDLGYIPYDVGVGENAARTLEFAYADWCIYQLGLKLGKPQKDLEIYKKRAYNYKNLFDKDSNLMRGRNKDGSFQSPFNPLKWGDAFTEGNSWHYTWSVFHDPQGLIDLMGGQKSFNQMMDSVFTMTPVYDDSYYGFVIHEIQEMINVNMGQYAHGNQPIQHMLYLYNYSAQPWKSQYWSREVMDKLYNPTADGYCGDEDNGQTSAWYVFSALGFYPVCPGSDEYILGSPLMQSATIHLPNGKDIDIQAVNNSPENRYIDQMTLNGERYNKNYIKHKDLTKGIHIEYDMSPNPNTKRGINQTDRPYSLSNDEKSK